MATIDHTIAPGDTFTKLAERYQTTVDAIVKANPGVKPEALQVGQVVKIPRSGDPGVTNPPPTVPGGPDQEAIDAAGHAQLDADIKRYQETLAKNTPPNPTDMDEVKKVQIESAQVFEKACQNPALIDHANDGKRYVAEAMMTLDNAMHAKLDTDTQDILQKVAAAGSDTTAIYRCKDEAAKAVEAPLQNESTKAHAKDAKAVMDQAINQALNSAQDAAAHAHLDAQIQSYVAQITAAGTNLEEVNKIKEEAYVTFNETAARNPSLRAHCEDGRKAVDAAVQGAVDSSAHAQLDADISKILLALAAPGPLPAATITDLQNQANAILATAEKNPVLKDHAADCRRAVDSAVASAQQATNEDAEHKRLDEGVKAYDAAFAAAGTNIPEIDRLKAEGLAFVDSFAAGTPTPAMTAHVAEARKSIESMAQAGYDKAAHEQLDKDITAIVVGLSQPGITPDAINQLKAQADAILATAEQNPALTEHAAESRKTVDAAVAAANNTSSLASEHKRIDDSVKHYETAFAAAGTNLPQVDSLKAEANTLWDAFAANPELTAHANDARAATNNMAQAAYDTAAHQKLDSDVQNCLNQFYAVQPTTQAAIDKLRTDSNAVLAPAEANPLLAQHAADCRRTVNDAANLAQSHVTLDLQTKAILDKIWAPSANQSVWDACRTEIETVCAPYASEPRMTDHVNSSKALVNKAIADASAAKR